MSGMLLGGSERSSRPIFGFGRARHTGITASAQSGSEVGFKGHLSNQISAPLGVLDCDPQRQRALNNGTESPFLKLDSDFPWPAPNYPTGSKSTCSVEGQIERAWNAYGADQC